MNILFVIPYVPNLIRVRPYNLIRSLSARGHKLTVLTLHSNQQDCQAIDHLKPYCHCLFTYPLQSWRALYNSVVALPTGTPLQAVYCWHPAMADHLVDLINPDNDKGGYDIIHLEHLRGARYGLHLKSHRANHKLEIPIVWDSVDCITHLFHKASKHSINGLTRWLMRFDLGRTAHYEGWLLNQFDQVVVTSHIDKKALLALINQNERSPNIAVLPNGVDLNYFKPDKGIVREQATLVVSGKMSYHANFTMVHYLVKEIMPAIWSHRPDVKLWVVGKDPPPEIRAFAINPAISVTGSVGDIRPYLQRATIAVAPLIYAAGIQNKVLEAMACATPVVSTSQAISALSVQPDRDILIADEPGEFAGKVLSLLNSPQKLREIGQAGRRYVEERHSWRDITQQLEGIYLESIHRKRSSRSN